MAPLGRPGLNLVMVAPNSWSRILVFFFCFFPCRVLALRSMEDKDEVSRWREERKNNYPTLANVNRKVML